MDLRSTQLKDTYGNLLTIGTTAGAPTSGTLENGQGADITSLTIAGTEILIDSPNQAFLKLDRGSNSNYAINRFYTAGTEEWRLGTINDTTDNFYLTGGATADTKMITVRSGGDISFRDGSDNEAFYWDASAGSLGIGTTSPSGGKLHIYATATPAKFESSTTTLYNTYTNSNGNFGFLGSGNGVASGGSADDFGVQAVNNFVFATGGSTERMRITSAGTIKGIGTYTASGSIKIFEAERSGGAVASDWSYDDASTDMSLGTSTAHSFSLKTSDTNRLTIDSSGNVGIGTSSPAKKLDVSGEVRASSGILFGTDTASANALDDYEEGTFTPVVAGTWTANPTSLTGKYTKIGNVVHVQITFLGGTKASATIGYLEDLPFAASHGTGTVVDSGVIEQGSALFANTDRIWFSDNAFSVGTNRVTGTYIIN